MNGDEQFARARAGETDALVALIREHQPAIYSIALRMLGSREAAEDLTQEVFMQLGTKIGSIASKEHLRFWLRQVTANRAIDQLRHDARFPMQPLCEESPLFADGEEADPLLQHHLRGLLAELSAPARAVLVLRYQEDLDPVDIARTLEMPINTVKSHLKRSLEALRIRCGLTTV
jgi:RNA polymerase sigma-70 factor (ECF subfamily)